MPKQASGFYLVGIYIYNKPLLFYFLLAIVAYWPISFFLFSIQYDMIDVVLPWRYFAGECIQNNLVPLWDPYQQCGFPIHADFQYSLWYPEVYLIGFIFGYTNITLQLLYILYILLAGLGMYKLARELTINHHYALLTGSVFMLCGIFVGHAQSLVSILGATWLPWVIAYYIRTINSKFKFSQILKLVLFTFLMLTGGYQAVSFMLFYLLIALFVYKLRGLIISRHYQELKYLILSHIIYVVFILILCFGLIVSLYYTFPYVDRLSGLSYEISRGYAFTPQCLISFLYPFAAITNHEFFNTDISITNGFIGVLVLIGGFIGLFRKKSGFMTILLIFGAICFLASFGKYTPVQKLLFSYVPFMNLFRFPSFYRYFAILALLLSAGYFFTHHIENDKLYRNKTFLWLLSIALFTYLAGVLISTTKINFPGLSNRIRQMNTIESFRQGGFYENIFIQGIIQFIILGIFLFLILFKKLVNKSLILLFTILELILAVQLNLPVTGFGSADPKEIREKFNRFPQGFPIPDQIELRKNLDLNNTSGVLWRNLGNFNKQVSSDAFTSFMFSGWTKLADYYPSLRDSILSNELVYLSNDIRSSRDHVDSAISKKTVFLPDSVWERFAKLTYSSHPGDTAFIASFQPDKIVCSVSLKSSQWINLIQNDYKGWQVFIDSKAVDHYTSNFSLISLPVPAGDHEVMFVFQMDLVRDCYIISVLIFLLLIILIYYYRLKEYGNPGWVSISLALFISGLLLVSFLIVKNQREKNRINKQLSNDRVFARKQAELGDSTLFLLSWDNINLIRNQSIWKDKTYYACQNIRTKDIIELSKILSTGTNRDIYYSRRRTIENPTALGLLKYVYPESEKIFADRNFTQQLFSKSLLHGSMQSNIFRSENVDNKWHIHAEMDSLRFYSSPVSCFIGKEYLYGPTLTLYGKDLIEKKNRILTFNGRIYWEKPARSYLVVEIKRGNQTLLYETENLLEFNYLENDWSIFSQGVWLSDYIKANDEIKIYIWNPGQAIFWIDDLQVEIFNNE